jgi:6-phosphogluconolactonase (cycloisomerase 2 family)
MALASADQLSSLARHPTLRVVYGGSSTAREGHLWAWRLEGDGASLLSYASSRGRETCHVAVHPRGRLLVFTNYGTSALGVQPLGGHGRFEGPAHFLTLEGSGPDADRQEAAHPHQAVFDGDALFVVDLGADMVREFSVDDRDTVQPVRTTRVPPGTGPRHCVVLPDGRLAVSGELNSTLVVGRPGDPPEAWVSVPSTSRTGPAKTRSPRNYPGDIQRSQDGRHVYLANRGYDTIAVFDVSGPTPELVLEREAGVAWPEHLLVTGAYLLIAGWDSSAVAAMPLADGVPGEPTALLACDGAGWLLLVD